MELIGAVDAWATLITPEGAKLWPEEFLHIFRRYKVIEPMTRGMSAEEMIAEMDAAGVEISVFSAFYYGDIKVMPNEDVAQYVQRFPDRFVGAGTVEPRGRPMEVLAAIEHMVNDLGVRILRLEPYAYGDGMTGTPPNDKMYWPIYAKCCELDVPVCIQVGHTGPRLPSEPGRPIYLDEVALAFPDLTIVGCHLGQPWHEEMMILAWKHPNVYVETSARRAKYWPESFKEFARGYGQDKVLWATDYPLISFKDARDDVRELGLSSDVERKLLRDNALRALKIER